MPPKKKVSRDLEAFVESYGDFLQFIFLIPDISRYDKKESLSPFSDFLQSSLQSLANKVHNAIKSESDPLPSIIALLKFFLHWDIVYRRFKYGFKPSECTDKKKFLRFLSIEEDKKSIWFKRLTAKKIKIVTDTSVRLDYKRICRISPPFDNVEMISLYSEATIYDSFPEVSS